MPKNCERTIIFNIPFIVCDINDVISHIIDVLENFEKGSEYICATGVHGIVESQRDDVLRQVLQNAFMNVPDGRPIAKLGHLLGAKAMRQIRGPDLFLAVCSATSQMDVSHFFYGGKPGIADKLAQNMQKKFPGLKVAGTFCPPFRSLNEEEKKRIVDMINNSGADIVWVGLSTPKQEKWIGEFAPHLQVKLLFSVGAAFDFHTGGIKECPVFIRKLYLEWLYRLINEPKRLWKRYLKIVPVFLLLAFKELLSHNFNEGGNK